MIDKHLLEIIVCPENRTRLKEADAALLDRMNAAIRAGQVKNHAGQAVADPIETGLVREDGAVLYPVREGIPLLLIDEGISLASLS